MQKASLSLPRVIAVAGKKKAGKDYFCDEFVARHGYTKIHIADAWIRKHLEMMGVSWAVWETHKAAYRPEIQRRATLARAANPNCLVDELEAAIDKTGPVIVSGLRFINEAAWFIAQDYAVVLIETEESVRANRFAYAGEDLAKLQDPFEAEVSFVPHHVRVSGTMAAREYPQRIARAFRSGVPQPYAAVRND